MIYFKDIGTNVMTALKTINSKSHSPLAFQWTLVCLSVCLCVCLSICQILHQICQVWKKPQLNIWLRKAPVEQLRRKILSGHPSMCVLMNQVKISCLMMTPDIMITIRKIRKISNFKWHHQPPWWPNMATHAVTPKLFV